MACARPLDRTPDEHRLIAGLNSSAHRTVGATDSHWWNHRIGVLPRLSRIRSQVELDGTISLYPRQSTPTHRTRRPTTHQPTVTNLVIEYI